MKREEAYHLITERAPRIRVACVYLLCTRFLPRGGITQERKHRQQHT